MQITEQEDKAANEIVELIANELGKNRAIHPNCILITSVKSGKIF